MWVIIEQDQYQIFMYIFKSFDRFVFLCVLFALFDFMQPFGVLYAAGRD